MNKRKKKSQKEKGRKIEQRREGKNVAEEEERGTKEKRDFPGIPTIESRRSKS